MYSDFIRCTRYLRGRLDREKEIAENRIGRTIFELEPVSKVHFQ